MADLILAAVPIGGLPQGLVEAYQARCGAADTASVILRNVTGAAIDDPVRTWIFLILNL